MLGTFVNFVAIIIGSLIGLIIKGGIKERYKVTIMQSTQLSVLFIGISATLPNMMDKKASPLLFIISLVIGAFIGEFLNIEGMLERFGNFLQLKLTGSSESNFSVGFVTSSLLFCVGAMAILGSLEGGLQNKHTTLFAKSVLDCIAALILASTYGAGVIGSAFSVLLYQGAIALSAHYIAPYINADILRETTIVGGILLFSLGLTMLEIKKIKIGNLLPALFIPAIYYVTPIHIWIEKLSGMFLK